MTVRLRLRGLNRLPKMAGRIWIWAEYFLLIGGVIVLALAALALADSAFSSRRVDPLHSTVDAEEIQKQSSHPLLLKHPTPDNAALARLDIPRLNVSVPLLEGTDVMTLNRGVGRITGTSRPGERGNIGIAGHRDTYFRGLRNIKLGDVIELRRTEGMDTYKVDRVQIVRPDDVSVLRPKPVPTVTLVTCYPFYFVGSAPKRFVVTASLVTTIADGEAATDVGLTTSVNPLNKEKQ